MRAAQLWAAGTPWGGRLLSRRNRLLWLCLLPSPQTEASAFGD